MLTLVGGGARSGKSTFALNRAKAHIAIGGRVLFIATAEAVDAEMSDRIKKHQEERGEGFDLIEEPINLAKALTQLPQNELVVIDCLTIWLSNLMMKDIDAPIHDVIDAAKRRSGATIFVTNETGEGIVPMHPVSRKFRDLSGNMNQEFAHLCDEVFYMRFGIEAKIK